MARAPWAIPNKESGNGNDTVSWSASEHTGREARQTQATFAASGVSPSPVLTIIQSGKTEFVSFDSATAAVDKTGGTLTITGKSNSSKLTFSLTGANGIGLVLPASYLANSVATNNGSAITFSVNVGGTVISRVLTVLQPAQSELIVPIYNGVYPSYNDVARGFAVSIPSEYQRVEYISAIGTSVIDTGIVAEETDVIYAAYMLNPDYLSVNTDKMIICCRDGYSGGGLWAETYSNSNRWYARFGSPSSVNGLFDTYLSGKHTAELKKQSLSIDGNKILAPSFSSMPNTSICFAGKLNTSNVIAWGFYGNLYEGTGILKADGSARWWGIPVKRISDGAGGMFDVVSHNFHPSLGTAPFGVGPAV